MKISFADRRPDGEYALVLPVAGKDRSSLASLGAAEQTMVEHSTASVLRAMPRRSRNSLWMTVER